MLRVGIVGIGFMGYTHFEGIRDLKEVNVSAICTRSKSKLDGDWTGIQGNFGPPGGQVDVSLLARYTDYNDLIADPNVDLIDVCLPTEKHKEVVLAAIAAGKPVLVEKPIAVNLDDAREMVEAASAANVPLFVAHVLPFMPEFHYAAQSIRFETHGKLIGGHLKRVICPPDWSDDMADFRNLGGWGIDLHIHDNHFITYACGRPHSVYSRGLLEDGLVNHVHTSYAWKDSGPALTCLSGGIAATGLQFSHGFEFYFQNGTLLFEAGTLAGEWTVDRPLSLLNNDGTITHPELNTGDNWCAAFTEELRTVAAALATGKSAGPLDARKALDALEICYAETRSIESGTVVVV
ncbi:MAG: Gfo/Idh/MocA family oxidoreductase [Fuerstiella sp.]|nr:Gfo/Idh/MocA family oxidoreductase [Fuerstiella sp.]